MTEKIADRLRSSKYSTDKALNLVSTYGISFDKKDSFADCITSAVDYLKEAVDMYTRELEKAVGGTGSNSVILDESKRTELWNRMADISNKLNTARGVVQNEMPVTSKDIDAVSAIVDSVCLDLSAWAEDLRRAFKVKE